MAAIQNTARKSSAISHIRPMARSGPKRRRSCRAIGAAEARAAQMRRRNVGDQGVTRCAANAFADPVDEARGNQPSDRRRQRKHRPGKGRQAIAERGEQFALAKPVAQRAGEDLVIDAVASAMPSISRRLASRCRAPSPYRSATGRGSSPTRCPSASRRSRATQSRPECLSGVAPPPAASVVATLFPSPEPSIQRFSFWPSKARCGDTQK